MLFSFRFSGTCMYYKKKTFQIPSTLVQYIISYKSDLTSSFTLKVKGPKVKKGNRH